MCDERVDGRGGQDVCAVWTTGGAMMWLWCLLSLGLGVVIGYVVGRLHAAVRFGNLFRGR